MKKYYILLLGLLLIGWALPSAAQSRAITGKVTSATDKEPIPGVSVVVKGTTIGTSTDINGKYSINVPSSKSVLVFSYISMKTVEIAVGGNTTVDVVMEDDGKGLDEVVVTAVALEKSAKSLGYSTQKVTGKEVSESGEQNVIQGLSGKAAGVFV